MIRFTAMGLCLLALGHGALAQQAIVNMPSADITPKGKHFLMHETQVRTWNPGRYWYGTNFYAYGVGKATELTVTNWNSGTPAAPNFVTGVGFKSSPQILRERWGDREIKVTVGQKLLVSHRGQGLGSFSFGHLSMVTPKTGTRLTFGGWHGTKELFKRTTGDILAGLEQPLDKKGRLVWVNEWFRGQHDFGFFVTGLLIHPNKRDIFVVAYKTPNTGRNGGAGLVLEYGVIF